MNLTTMYFFFRGQKELAGDILSRILQSMPPGQAVNRYEDMFLEGLVHPEDLVKELIIHEASHYLNKGTLIDKKIM